MSQDRPTKQLKMIWPHTLRSAPLDGSLPAGYTLRSYREGDIDRYIRLMNRAGFAGWGRLTAERTIATALPGGLLFVVHDATEALVATAAAQRHRLADGRYAGELGWVGTDPGHQRQGLGYAVCAAATRLLLQAGLCDLFLLTDDPRLPAIRTYLKLGWVPLLHAPDMEARWRAVAAELGVAFESLGAVTALAGADPASPPGG